MINFTYFWLIIAVLLIVFEMGNPGLFFFLSLCFGALSAALSSFLGYSLITQCITFLITTGIAFIGLTYWVKCKSKIGYRDYKSNVFALCGKKGIVIACIRPEQPGYVKIDGEVWPARIMRDTIFDVGTEVTVTNVVGCHVLVDKSS